MKYKDKWIIGDRELFLLDALQHETLHPEILTLKGKIVIIPRKNTGNEYIIQWDILEYNGKFESSHLRRVVNTNEKTMVKKIKEGRIRFEDLSEEGEQKRDEDNNQNIAPTEAPPPVETSPPNAMSVEQQDLSHVSGVNTTSTHNSPLITPQRIMNRLQMEQHNTRTDSTRRTLPTTDEERIRDRYNYTLCLGDWDDTNANLHGIIDQECGNEEDNQINHDIEHSEEEYDDDDEDLEDVLIASDSVEVLDVINEEEDLEIPNHESEDMEAEDDGLPPHLEDDNIAYSQLDMDLSYRFKDVPPEGIYNEKRNSMADEKASLRETIPKMTFDTPLSTFLYSSGLNMEFYKKMVVNMNEYANDNVTNGQFAGTKWNTNNFTIEGLLHVLGILLKISLDGR